MIGLTKRAAIVYIAGVFLMPLNAFSQASIELPTIEFIGNRSVEVTQTLGINVFAYSQSEEIPWLWADSLPDGADFFDRGEGYRTFLCLKTLLQSVHCSHLVTQSQHRQQ